MRVDKYLKVSRIIKRRTLANEACEQGRVSINCKTAKPGNEINLNDELEIRFGNGTTKIRITSITEHVRKGEAKEMYEII